MRWKFWRDCVPLEEVDLEDVLARLLNVQYKVLAGRKKLEVISDCELTREEQQIKDLLSKTNKAIAYHLKKLEQEYREKFVI